MDPVRNPYVPGAGRPPMALVGREEQLRAFEVARRRVASGRSAQSLVLYGLRGVGKTVLLSRFAGLARDDGWLVAQIEGNSGRSMRELIGDAFHDELVDLARPSAPKRILKALKTILSFKASYDTSGTWSFGLDLGDQPGGGADTGEFEADLAKLLRDLAGAAEEQGRGVLLVVDEAQDLISDEMVALCSIVHAANQRSDRLLVAMAGLPNLPRRLSVAKSYAERLFWYSSIGPLERGHAEAALVDPARVEGVAFTDGALSRLVDAADGYPYFLQQYGQDTWNAAAGSPITIGAAETGIREGRLALDLGFFRARWDRTTAVERDYLRAMAVDGEAGSLSATVAARLGRTATALGSVRTQLINKGLIYAPEHAGVAFTVPTMADFVNRQSD